MKFYGSDKKHYKSFSPKDEVFMYKIVVDIKFKD